MRRRKLLSGTFALGNVGQNSFKRDQTPVAIAQRNAFSGEPDLRAVGLVEAKFRTGMVGLPRRQRLKVGEREAAIIAIDQLRPTIGRSQQLIGFIAVAADIVGHEHQRKRFLRSQPIHHHRTVFDDAVGIPQNPKTTQRGDCRADQLGQNLDDVDVGGRPVALASAIVKANEAPPLTVHEYRHAQCRLDGARFQEFPRGKIEITRVSDNRFAARQLRHPGTKSHLSH